MSFSQNQLVLFYTQTDFADLPSTSMFFSGSLFPLATPSSIDDHMFSSVSPLACSLSLWVFGGLGRGLGLCFAFMF